MTDMNLPLEEQVRGFLIAVAAGLIMGLLYDLFRVYRLLMRPPRRQVFFLDVLVLCACAFLTFLVALAVSNGTLRFYIFLGEGIGWCAYALSLGQVTVRLARVLLRLLQKLLFAPLARLWAFCRGGLARLARRGKSFWKKIFKQRKKPLKQRGNVVYNRNRFTAAWKRGRGHAGKGGG